MSLGDEKCIVDVGSALVNLGSVGASKRLCHEIDRSIRQEGYHDTNDRIQDRILCTGYLSLVPTTDHVADTTDDQHDDGDSTDEKEQNVGYTTKYAVVPAEQVGWLLVAARAIGAG